MSELTSGLGFRQNDRGERRLGRSSTYRNPRSGHGSLFRFITYAEPFQTICTEKGGACDVQDFSTVPRCITCGVSSITRKVGR